MEQKTTYVVNIDKLPLLQYLKNPVHEVGSLYAKYPLGGQYGWFVWVEEKKTFYYWDTDVKDWLQLAKTDLVSLLGIDQSLLRDGDIPVYDKATNKFIIINLSLWGTEEY